MSSHTVLGRCQETNCQFVTTTECENCEKLICPAHSYTGQNADDKAVELCKDCRDVVPAGKPKAAAAAPKGKRKAAVAAAAAAATEEEPKEKKTAVDKCHGQAGCRNAATRKCLRCSFYVCEEACSGLYNKKLLCCNCVVDQVAEDDDSDNDGCDHFRPLECSESTERGSECQITIEVLGGPLVCKTHGGNVGVFARGVYPQKQDLAWRWLDQKLKKKVQEKRAAEAEAAAAAETKEEKKTKRATKLARYEAEAGTLGNGKVYVGIAVLPLKEDVMLGLFANSAIAKNEIVTEYGGELSNKSDFKKGPGPDKSHARAIPGTDWVLDGKHYSRLFQRTDVERVKNGTLSVAHAKRIRFFPHGDQETNAKIMMSGIGYMSNTAAKSKLNVKIVTVFTGREAMGPPRIFLMATREIEAGEEILSPYNNNDPEVKL